MVRKVKSLEELRRNYIDKGKVIRESYINNITFVIDMFKYAGKEIELNIDNSYKEWTFDEWMLEPSEKGLIHDEFDLLFNNFIAFLKEKNKRYGNSAMSPVNIVSKVSAENQICNRLDDKLSRVKNSSELKKNDVSDIFGYIALLMIQNNWTTFDEMLD